MNNKTSLIIFLLAEFFGVLPNISDGLEFQKNVRNEWD